VFLRYSALCLTTSLMWGALVPRIEARTQNEKELEGFYIVTHVVSDASPFHYEYVLDVKPQGKDVLVRQIRIAPMSSGCPSGLTVKAADRLIPKKSLRKILKIELCSLKAKDVSSAIDAARPGGVAGIDDTASYSIVTMCGRTEKVFELPYPETVDLIKLKRTNPQAATLWDLAAAVEERSFGKDFSFQTASDNQNAAFQALGAEIVPAIRAGLYAKGFEQGSHLVSLLDKYTGPAKEIDPWIVEFIGPPPADLSQYQLPRYPPLARQTRIEGEVHLTLMLDIQTGHVRGAKVNAGHPLLAAAAVAAVRDWHFREGSSDQDSIEVALKFLLDCPPQ